MRRVFLLFVVIVAACGTEPTGVHTAVPPTAATALKPACRLPVWLYGWSGSANLGTGYFLQGSNLVPAQPPVTSGDSVASYIASPQRWLHVTRNLVAPDGEHYAYNEAVGSPEIHRVHVVDLATGADRVIAAGDSNTGYEALDFQADGVYGGRPAQGPGTVAGLWRLDPLTGAAMAVDGSHHWLWISRGFAYTIIPNPTDPVIVQGGPQLDTLLRLDEIRR